MWPDRTGPIGTVCSGYTLFVSILKSSVMLGIYLQMPFFRVVFFFFFFFLPFWGLKINLHIDACICLVNEQCGYQFILLSIYIVIAEP